MDLSSEPPRIVLPVPYTQVHAGVAVHGPAAVIGAHHSRRELLQALAAPLGEKGLLLHAWGLLYFTVPNEPTRVVASS